MKNNGTEQDMQVRDFETVAELREAFPSAFLANGNVDLSRQPSIRTLPRDMVVDHHLILDDCPNLIETPDGLIVKGWMCVNGCGSLQKIGKAEVTGSFQVRSCRNLSEISPALKSGELLIIDCASLSQIPSTVRVEWSVRLSFCPEIKEVPWNTVRGAFSAVGCTSLSTLPSPFSVGGYLDISGTRGLELRDDVTAPLIFARRCEGLTISESLIERMQGNVDLDGSEYTVSNPSAEEPSPSPS